MTVASKARTMGRAARFRISRVSIRAPRVGGAWCLGVGVPVPLHAVTASITVVITAHATRWVFLLIAPVLSSLPLGGTPLVYRYRGALVGHPW